MITSSKKLAYKQNVLKNQNFKLKKIITEEISLKRQTYHVLFDDFCKVRMTLLKSKIVSKIYRKRRENLAVPKLQKYLS